MSQSVIQKDNFYTQGTTYTADLGICSGCVTSGQTMLAFTCKFPNKFSRKPTINSVGLAARYQGNYIENWSDPSTPIDTSIFNITVGFTNRDNDMITINITRKDKNILFNTGSFNNYPCSVTVLIQFTA